MKRNNLITRLGPLIFILILGLTAYLKNSLPKVQIETNDHLHQFAI